MEILILFVLGYVAYLHSQLTGVRTDIKNLQNKSQKLPQEAYVSTTQANQQVTVQNQSISAPQAQQVPPSATPASQTVSMPKEPAFIAWVKEDFFVKLGALLLLIAFGWFVNYAFANDWIGPMGRITLGLMAGVLILFAGVWRIQKYKQQGGIFTVLGSAVILLTCFAAREVYDIFTPVTALAVMSLSVIFVAFVSVRYQSEKIAIASLLLATVAPLMTNDPGLNSLSLFSYWLVMVLGTLWVVKITASSTLTPLALFITGLYSVPFILGFGMSGDDKMIGLLFAFVFTAIFFITNIISITHRNTKGAQQGHTITALLTGVYLVSWISFSAPEQWQSMLYIAWMLVFSVGAFAVYIQGNNRSPFYIYSAVGVGLLAAATATELQGPTLTIVYSIELMLLMFVLALYLKDRTLTLASSTLFVGLGLLSLNDMSPYFWREGFMHAHFAALVFVTLTFFSASILLFRTQKEGEKVPQAPVVLSIIGLLYTLMLVWLVTGSVLNPDIATTVSLVIYTVLGIGMFVKGKVMKSTVVTVLGSVLLGGVVTRLLLIDIWQMDLVGRVVAFGAIGLLLMSTAFIGKKK